MTDTLGDVPLNELMHYGVRGMKWGVRRKAPSAPSRPLNVQQKGIRIGADGSVSIDRGVNLQRLVYAKEGVSRPLKDVTYASVLEYDNAKYVNYIGNKGFLPGRDTIISMKATRQISAPPVKEAVRMNTELILNDPTYLKSSRGMFGERVTRKELKRMRNDPTGKEAERWYVSNNQAMTYDVTRDKDAAYIQTSLKKKVESKGFNALRDENDFTGKLTKAPLVLFSPEKTLKVTTVNDITDELRSASKDTLKQYKSLGKDWAEKQLYT